MQVMDMVMQLYEIVLRENFILLCNEFDIEWIDRTLEVYPYINSKDITFI